MKSSLFFFRHAVLAFVSTGIAGADIQLPAILSDHMVLQKTAKVPVWGTADPGEEVAVSLDGQTVTTRTDENGRWRLSLDLGNSAAGPFEMTVVGKNKRTVSDVVVGEVWVAAGQSNMAFVVKNGLDAENEIARSASPLIRQFLVGRAAANEPRNDTEGKWVAASPGTTGNFSAVGYFFAKKLQANLGGAVGVIASSWGGTPCEAWTSVEAIDSVPELKASRKRLWAMLEAYPEKKKAFADGMEAWIKENGHEDKPPADVAAFAGENVSPDGWIPLKLPGVVMGGALPKFGAVWLRKEIDIPTPNGINLPLYLPIDGFDSVYWNGKLVKQTTFRDFPGTGSVRRWGPYDILPADIKKGKNILAIRLYEPVGPAKFTADPKAGPIPLAGVWQARAEYEFPPLDAQKTATAPLPPVNDPGSQNVAGYLFNGMVHPILPYAIRGVIWYQGENNAVRAFQYRTAFPLLISDWRNQWKQGDFPFYFCQLANYTAKKSDPGESQWAELREAQSMTLKLPNTGQAVLIDIGESGDIHPRNKQDVGERLARIALAKDYGQSISWSGPVYDSMTVDKGRAVLRFLHADGGLLAKPLPAVCDVKSQTKETAPLIRNSPASQIEGFAICGADKNWIWADAKIDGDKVVVWSDKVPEPLAVRYAWADNPTCNLYNGAGLPASPFRTDDFPPMTLNAKY